MIGRKAVVGLSLLCALCFCAFAASSASAKGTTAGECKSASGSKDFKDAHCDEEVAAGTGSFGHVLFEKGSAVKYTGVNDTTGTKTPWMLEGKLAGVVVTVECTEVTSAGSVTNEEVGGVMKLKFGDIKVTATGCTVPTQPACTVEVPVFETGVTDPMNLKKEAVEKTGPTGEIIKAHAEVAGSTEMGLKFAPTEGTTFVTLVFSGVGCPAALKGNKPVQGFAYGTSKGRGSTEATSSSGATLTFSKETTASGLTFGGNTATLVGTQTLRKEGGNPLILTTTST